MFLFLFSNLTPKGTFFRLQCTGVEGTKVKGSIKSARKKWKKIIIDEEWRGEIEKLADEVLGSIE